MSMVWPILGSRTAEEQNRIIFTGNDLVCLMSTNKGTVNARNVRNVNSREQTDKMCCPPASRVDAMSGSC